MKITKLVLVSQILSLSFFAFSQTADDQTSDSSRFSLRTETTLPLFVGAGFGYAPNEKIDLSLFFGLTPEPYYRIIGKTAASMGNNAAYEDVIVAAFQNNSVQKALARYFFDTKESGWNIGFSGYMISSSGQAPISTVLTAATDRD